MEQTVTHCPFKQKAKKISAQNTDKNTKKLDYHHQYIQECHVHKVTKMCVLVGKRTMNKLLEVMTKNGMTKRNGSSCSVLLAVTLTYSNWC